MGDGLGHTTHVLRNHDDLQNRILGAIIQKSRLLNLGFSLMLKPVPKIDNSRLKGPKYNAIMNLSKPVLVSKPIKPHPMDC